MNALPRKPWEDSADYNALGEKAYQSQQGEDRAHSNMRKFVEGHVVLASPWKEGEKVKTMAGTEVWWEEKNGGKLVSIILRFGLEAGLT